jgi:hypothetical protein
VAAPRFCAMASLVGRWGIAKNAVHDAGLCGVKRDPLLGGILQCEEEPLGALLQMSALGQKRTCQYASAERRPRPTPAIGHGRPLALWMEERETENSRCSALTSS